VSRSVSVKLEADVGKYIPPVVASTEATEKLDDKIKDVDRDLDKVPAAAARAAASMTALGGSAEGLRGKLHDLGPEATNSLEVIDKRIEETRAAMKQFAEDFNKTGSTTSLAGMLGAKSRVSELESLKKDVSNALGLAAKDGEKAISDAIDVGGKEGSKSLLSSIQGVLSTPVLGPITTGAIIGAIAISAPAIGAAIGAAVIGGTGLGLIGLGIAGQINSPAVQSAFGVLKQHATDDLTASSSVFQSTLVGGLHTLTDEFDHIAPDVQRNLSKIAVPSQHLFAGIAEAIDRLGPGIDDLASAAAPFISQLAMELPKFAGSMSQMFQDISGGAPGAIQFFHDLFTVIDALVIATGKFAGAMETAYGWLRVAAASLAHGPLAGGDLARGLADVKGAQDAAAQSAKELKTNMEVAGQAWTCPAARARSGSRTWPKSTSSSHFSRNQSGQSKW